MFSGAGSLVQGVSGAGGAAGLHDNLGALAEVHHAVCTLAQEQAAVHGAALTAAFAGIDHGVIGSRYAGVQSHLAGGIAQHLAPFAAQQHIAALQGIGGHSAAIEGHSRGVIHLTVDGQGAAVPGQVLAPEDLGLRGLHKAHAVELTDLAGKQLRGGGVLMGGHPGGVLAQIKGHTGMNDTHILPFEGRRVHLLQLGGGLGHQLAGELALFRKSPAWWRASPAACRCRNA